MNSDKDLFDKIMKLHVSTCLITDSKAPLQAVVWKCFLIIIVIKVIAIEAPEGGDVRLPHSQVCVPVKHTAYNVDDDDCDDEADRLQRIAL